MLFLKARLPSYLFMHGIILIYTCSTTLHTIKPAWPCCYQGWVTKCAYSNTGVFLTEQRLYNLTDFGPGLLLHHSTTYSL